jgi:hypothetical protein
LAGVETGSDVLATGAGGASHEFLASADEDESEFPPLAVLVPGVPMVFFFA